MDSLGGQSYRRRTFERLSSHMAKTERKKKTSTAAPHCSTVGGSHKNLVERINMARSVWSFGQVQGVQDLAEVVMDLYDAALRVSSRNTYRTGQRAYDRFMVRLTKGRYFPFEPQVLSETELNLAFFMAFLLIRTTYKSCWNNSML